MVRGQHDDDLLVQQIVDLEPSGVQRPAQKATSRVPLRSQAGLDGVLAVQDQPQVRQPRGERADAAEAGFDVGRWKGADREIAGVAVRRLASPGGRVFDAAEDVLRFAQEHAPCVVSGT